MSAGIDIYFGDLNMFVQKELLNAAGVNNPNEMNWDVLPITTLYFDNENS